MGVFCLAGGKESRNSEVNEPELPLVGNDDVGGLQIPEYEGMGFWE